jgi:transaldolase / glucose-6-phosphate isomerase
MNAIQKLYEAGQSLWYDNIQRGLIESGELEGMIDRGDIRGVTSNPTIFNTAIARSNDYDNALKPMAWAGWSSEDIFYQLALEDIRAAADLFRPLYEETQGGDGYVSLEVSPYLANDTDETVAEAKRLWNLVERPNLMVKIPATMAGIPAIRQAIAAGINVNVTLIFSLARYAMVMDAYLSGLEDRSAQGLPIGSIASVASFFVSRVDSKVDKRLEHIMRKESEEAETAANLRGKVAIANSRLAYGLFKEKFGDERFARLKEQGGRLQRPLWASTSTKNPAYRDVMYIEELVAPDTVNTAPPNTIELFKDHGSVRLSIDGTEREAQRTIEDLESLGISLDEVTRELEEEGVRSFADSFTELLETIEDRRKAYQSELGPLQQAVQEQAAKFEEQNTVQRLFDRDPTLWVQDSAQHTEIKQRMGWLDAPYESRALIPELKQFVRDIQGDGYTHALLLGMGGSSLAPEVLAQTFGPADLEKEFGLDLAVLDSTDPAQVRAAAHRSPVEQTLYIVSSKSGTTSEVHAFLNYFWALAIEKLGEKAGEHFIAITDPGTSLEALAKERGFRQVFTADPTVGGRNSALIAFGLVPAALIGLNIERLLDQAQAMADQCQPDVPVGRNPALMLGAVLGVAALQGRDKLTILTDPEFDSFGSWLEQLTAESSGKDGKGIVPVDLEPILKAKNYSKDRLFAYIHGSGQLEDKAERLMLVGYPVVVIEVHDGYQLAAEFYRWEIAVAIACSILGVNSFNQPDVQDSKDRTKTKINEYRETGSIQEGSPIWEGQGGRVYGRSFPGLEQAQSLKEVVHLFVRQAGEGDYIAINAYLPRNQRMLNSLQKLRRSILKDTGHATTLGFGPRFLHSTGQLHKGGPNNGVFLQITDQLLKDLDIPDQNMSFGTLESAQALGDLEALLARDRRAIRVHLTTADIEDLV